MGCDQSLNALRAVPGLRNKKQRGARRDRGARPREHDDPRSRCMPVRGRKQTRSSGRLRSKGRIVSGAASLSTWRRQSSSRPRALSRSPRWLGAHRPAAAAAQVLSVLGDAHCSGMGTPTWARAWAIDGRPGGPCGWGLAPGPRARRRPEASPVICVQVADRMTDLERTRHRQRKHRRARDRIEPPCRSYGLARIALGGRPGPCAPDTRRTCVAP